MLKKLSNMSKSLTICSLLLLLASCGPFDGSRIQYPHGTYVKVLDGYRGVVIEPHPKGAKVYYEDYYYKPHIKWFKNEEIYHAEF